MKILTIVVPTYNTEKYLRRCLDSVLVEEVLEDIEVIVVSDGSKDGSLKIMREYAREFPKTVNVIDKENGGHGSTINAGLKVANGKYFRVLDSDDWFNTHDFILLIQRLKNLDTDLVVTNYRKEHVYNEVSEYLEYKNLEEGKTYSFDAFDLDILAGEYFVMATSMYKTSVLREAKLELLEKTFYVDMIYNAIPILKTNTFSYLDLDIYRYFIGRKDQSVNLDSFVRNQAHHDRVVRYLIEFYENNKAEMNQFKQSYIRLMFKYMIYTHYCIFLMYEKDMNNSYNQLKAFDAYLKKASQELYSLMSTYRYIGKHRDTKFIFVKLRMLKLLNYLVNRGGQ